MEKYLVVASNIVVFEFYTLIVIISSLERFRPRRASDEARRSRWFGNFVLDILDRILVPSLIPLAGVGLAFVCAEHGWGLMNQFELPSWFKFALTLVLIDAIAYSLHYMMHRLPLLWRIHRLHHTDQNVDFSTAVRFHPLEALVTKGVGLCTTLALGPAPLHLVMTAPFFLFIQFFSHANLRMPKSLDRFLRLFIVTPDMHRIHHSQVFRESTSNFGSGFSWWDWLFGTYVAQPESGHDNLIFGVAEFSGRKHLTLPWMLAQPFLNAKPSQQPAQDSTLEIANIS